MLKPEARCRALLDETLTLDRDRFVISVDEPHFAQAVELARTLDVDLAGWLAAQRWFYAAPALLRLLLPADRWQAEARLFAADCAAHCLDRLTDPPAPGACADAVAAARAHARGELTDEGLAAAHLRASAAVGEEPNRRFSAAAGATMRSVDEAVRRTSADAAWSITHNLRDGAPTLVYGWVLRWQQDRLLERITPYL